MIRESEGWNTERKTLRSNLGLHFSDKEEEEEETEELRFLSVVWWRKIEEEKRENKKSKAWVWFSGAFGGAFGARLILPVPSNKETNRMGVDIIIFRLKNSFLF